MIVAAVGLLALLVAFLLVFVRASIEVGEERLWLYVWLFFMPPLAAAAVIWGFPNFTWPVRAMLGATAAVLVAVGLVLTALSADRVYEEPARFRFLLSPILRAEAAYLSVFRAEPHRHTRHKEKEQRWANLQGSR